MASEVKKPIFRDLNADEPDPEATEIESLCMNCRSNGTTRLLLTKIPFYKEVVIMSFSCEDCGYANNEIQPGGQIADKGLRIRLEVKAADDLNRQVVKSDYTGLRIVELDFEVPPKSQKGEVTTVEGIIDRCVRGLEQDQPARRIESTQVADQIDAFVDKLKALKAVVPPFTLVLEDISGNSFVENPNAPHKDPNCSVQHFARTAEQDNLLGIYTKDQIESSGTGILRPVAEDEHPLEDFQGEVLQFATNCNKCGSPCETNMKLINIPHFKDVVIMATTCDTCGNRTNEVKSGGGIEPKGVKIEVDVKGKRDLTRDVLKSETCELLIPQLDLEVGAAALGGRFTTVEGLLRAMRDQLGDHIFRDSQDFRAKERMDAFLRRFGEIVDGDRAVTIVLDDPAGNSYVQSMRDDDLPDEGLRISQYERSFEQNDDLGLNDMKTENYEGES